MGVDRIYMDSACFIEAVQSSIGQGQTGRERDLWFIKQLLVASKSGEVEVITSYLTLAECRGSLKDGPPSDEVKRLIRSILSSGKVVKLAQLTKATAERARDLVWNDNLNLDGADAVHVATALVTGCKEFLTFDRTSRKAPLKYANELRSFGLMAIEPSASTLLPAHYFQRQLPNTK